MGVIKKVSQAVDGFLTSIFFKLGVFVGTNPWRVILFMVLICGGLGSGLTRFRQENRQEKLWVAQGTVALDNRQDLLDTFGDPPRLQNFIFTPVEGTNIVTKDNILAIMEFQELITHINVTVDDAPHREEGPHFYLENLCVQGGPLGCLSTGLSLAWADNITRLQDDDDFIQTIMDAFDENQLKLILGAPKYDANGRLESGEAATVIYFTRDEPIDLPDVLVELRDVPSEEWELEVLNMALRTDNTWGGGDDANWAKKVHCDPLVARSFKDEIGGAIVGDIGIVSASYLIIIAYVIVNLSRCDRVYSAWALSGMSILCAGCSIMAAFGTSLYSGVPYGQVHSILPFIILGIGVDDSFVLNNAWQNLGSSNLSITERAGKCLAHAGVSVTVTSLTNFVAFAIGSLTVLPDLASFCTFAAFGVFYLWLTQITIFMAAIVINERRIQQSRIDCCCCFKDSRRKRRATSETEYENIYAADNESKHGFMKRFVNNHYIPFLMNDKTRYTTLILAAVFFALMVYNITLFQVAATGNNFIPSDSYAMTTLNIQTKYFAGAGTGVDIITKDIDYHANLGILASMESRFNCDECELDVPYLDPTQWDSWLDEYLAALVAHSAATMSNTDFGIPYTFMGVNMYWTINATLLDPATGFPLTSDIFYEYLRIWIDDSLGLPNETPGGRWTADIIFDNEDTRAKINRARIRARHGPIGEFDENGEVFTENALEESRAMFEMYKIADKLGEDGIDCYVYSFKYTSDWESYAVIPRELIQNLSLALTAVLIITTILIGHPGASFLVLVSVVFTITGMLGMQPVIGLTVDTVAVVLFVLAVGLSVDYSAHIAHTFMTKHGTRKERVAKTLSDIGVAVLNGAVSTFLAIVFQSLSKSYVFVVVFYDFLLSIGIGAWAGLFLLPIILSFVGPDPYTLKVDEFDAYDVDDKEAQPQAQDKKLSNLKSEETVGRITSTQVMKKAAKQTSEQ